MLAPVVQIAWQGRRIHGITPDHVINVEPEIGEPKGRKARDMAAYWQDIVSTGVKGVIWMDPDMAVDPHDLEAMRDAIADDPHVVWIGQHRLWPASTGRDQWVWGHGQYGNGQPEMSQWCETDAGWFALGFTFTPRRLLNLAAPHMPAWVFGQVDTSLGQICRDNDIPIQTAPYCQPKHMHFTHGDNYLAWAGGGS